MAQQLLSPADVVAKAIDTCRDESRVMLELMGWFSGLAAVHWAFSWLMRSFVADAISSTAVLLLLSVPSSIVFSALTVIIIDYFAKVLQRKKPELHQEIGVGFHLVLPFLWVTILSGLAVAGGFILLVVPAVIFTIWYRFAAYHCVVDGLRGTAALRASKRLVSGRFWEVLVRVLVSGIFFYVTYQFILAVLYLVIGSTVGDPGLFFGNVSTSQEQSAIHALVTTVVPQIVTAMTLPAAIVAELIIWSDLKRTA